MSQSTESELKKSIWIYYLSNLIVLKNLQQKLLI